MSKFKNVDCSAMRPDEGALTVAAMAKQQGLNPFMLLVGPECYKNIEINLNYQHEYIDEERSYLVLRTPERLLVGTNNKLEGGKAVLVCRSPDVELEALLAF